MISGMPRSPGLAASLAGPGLGRRGCLAGALMSATGARRRALRGHFSSARQAAQWPQEHRDARNRAGEPKRRSPGDPTILRRVTSVRELMEVRCPLSPRPPTVSPSGSGPSAGRPATRSATPRGTARPGRGGARLAGLGAYGVSFHDDDLIPFGSDDADRGRHIDRFTRRARGDRPGGADDDDEPVHPPGVQGRRRSPATTAAVRRFALRKVMRNIDLAARARRAHLRDLGRARGQRVRRREGRPGGA